MVQNKSKIKLINFATFDLLTPLQEPPWSSIRSAHWTLSSNVKLSQKVIIYIGILFAFVVVRIVLKLSFYEILNIHYRNVTNQNYRSWIYGVHFKTLKKLFHNDPDAFNQQPKWYRNTKERSRKLYEEYASSIIYGLLSEYWYRTNIIISRTWSNAFCEFGRDSDNFCDGISINVGWKESKSSKS